MLPLTLLLPVLAATLSRAVDDYPSNRRDSSVGIKQYESSSTSTTAYASARSQKKGKLHKVSVGPNATLTFVPNNIKADPGDQIMFIFHPKNHTATQSSFNDPCTPLKDGFDSGFRPVAVNTTHGFPKFILDVKDDKPIWVHCKQPGPPRHCTSGMVFSANAPDSGNTFEAFQAKARALNSSNPSASHTTYSSEPTRKPAIHKIVVGGKNGNVYTPNSVKAEIGDIVRFEFQQKNHTVTQSSFDDPCTKLETSTYGSQKGFDTGFKPVAQWETKFYTWDLPVEDTKPIWGYCRQTGHCQSGMAFGINPPESGNTLKAFLERATGNNSHPSASYTTTKATQTYSSTYSSKPTRTPAIHKIVVGGKNGNVYTPNSVKAEVGDIVRFEFQQKNHTVTQSSFDDPCTKLETSTYGSQKGFDTGFKPVAQWETKFYTWDLPVEDTKPIWGYCRQTGHCQSGMAFGINPPESGNTLKAFLERATKNNSQSSASASHTTTKATQSYSSEPTRKPVVHNIIVGGKNGNVYTPNSVKAEIGDIVQFEFQQKNHTVTQSSFNDPCTKLETSSHGDQKGFDTGFMPVSPYETNFPKWNLTIKDSKPIWGYCRQTGHCQSGMAFGINPPKYGPNTLEAFLELAKHSGGTTYSAAWSTPYQTKTSTSYSAKPTSTGYY